MPKNYCIMQIWAESGKSALPICNYSQILYQFLTFTQNLKRSHPCAPNSIFYVSRILGTYHSSAGETLFLPHWQPLPFLQLSEVLLYIFHLFPVPASGVSDWFYMSRARIY